MQITPANKHEPVYDRWRILGLAVNGDTRALDLLRFNSIYPTRRHWHHAVHTAARLPCDDLCKPKATHSGQRGDVYGRIKAKHRIEDIAGKLTRLRGASVLSGKCPLHGERNGESFKIWVDDQKWKCFGKCQTGGDIVDFVRECNRRGIEWMTN